MAKNKFYFDYAATTPLDSKVLKKMLPHLKQEYGNPSSIYESGQKALTAIDGVRETVANFLDCLPEEIVFTGSASEANNLAIFGIVRTYLSKNIKPHIITSQIEHYAILEPCKVFEKERVEVTYLPVKKEGIVKVSDIEKAIKKNTVLVSIMYANNEIGTIQPIAKIGGLIRRANQKRGLEERIYFHTDAVQAVNYLNCNINRLKVDFLTLSAHKIYGPKGAGALYIRKGTKIKPLIYGGGQEFGLRSGTENVAGIVGLGAATKEVINQKSKIKKTEKLRDKLIGGVLKNIPNSRLNGSRNRRLPNNANFSLSGAEGESIVIALDQAGISASTGSACSSKTLEPSHVLLALGLSSKEVHSSLRVSLGRWTTLREIDYLIKVLPGIIQRLRKLSPFK